MLDMIMFIYFYNLYVLRKYLVLVDGVGEFIFIRKGMIYNLWMVAFKVSYGGYFFVWGNGLDYFFV